MSTALQLEVNLFAWRVRCTSESHCYFSFSHSADVLFFLTFAENDYFTPKCSWNQSTAIISNLCVWWLHQTPSEVIKSDQLQFKGLKKNIALPAEKSHFYMQTPTFSDSNVIGQLTQKLLHGEVWAITLLLLHTLSR